MSAHSQADRTEGRTEPIAIVGIGCRLPGNIATVEDLVTALRASRNCVTEIPSDRWNTEFYYDPDPVTPGKTYVRYGGFISDIDRFDASFFGITDAEAARMDPQQRIILETVWHALEEAGQSSQELLQSSTGVFLAMMNTNDYSKLKNIFEGLPGITGYDAMGDALSISAGRIAHFLGLEGPCLSLDTACSSSLVALHLARQSILTGDCDAAIVIGVSVILHPSIHIAFSKLGLMSRAGHCAAFDAKADGYVRGEGCVAVILRKQSVAVSRGDHIYASIVSSAMNHAGRTPALTTPNGHAQQKVMQMALNRIGISSNEIDYIEAHGTGTAVGDPIEMSAIVNVFGADRSIHSPLYVGSAKSNFGHLEAGAGLLGLVKTALSLDQELILPSLHFTRLNPNIKLEQLPLRIATTPVPWKRSDRRRLAGVNSFGYSGTNAHIILQEAPLFTQAKPHQEDRTQDSTESPKVSPSEIVVLSAQSLVSLQELAQRWANFLERGDSPALRSIAFTAAVGRTHFNHRLAIVGQDKQEISQKLRAWQAGQMPKGVATGQVPKRQPSIAFVFTGQGAQYANMGRQLYDSEPRFKASLDHCASLTDPQLDVPLSEILFGTEAPMRLSDTRYLQPALFALEYAIADLLCHWGIEPNFVIGHSVGEIVAACIAGVLDLEDATQLIVKRGDLMGKLPRGGKMLAINAPLTEVEAWVQDQAPEVSIAAINSPQDVVVSGTAEGVNRIAQRAQAAGWLMKELPVSHAFHSSLMEPMLAELEAVAATLQFHPAKIPLLSNVTGEFLSDRLTSNYWSTHVRQSVQFHEGINKILEAGCMILIEIGPHPVLMPAITTTFEQSQIPSLPTCLPTLMRDGQDRFHLLEAIAALHVKGVPLRLESLFETTANPRVALPLYPFRRDRYWLRTDRPLSNLSEYPLYREHPLTTKADLHPLLGRVVTASAQYVVFESDLKATTPWVDHRVLGKTVFPGTAYLEMAARGFAAFKGQDWQSVVLRDVVFERPLILKYGKTQSVSLTLESCSIPSTTAWDSNREGCRLDHAHSNGYGHTSNGHKNGGIDEMTFVIAAVSHNSAEVYCRGRIATAIADEVPSQGETVFSRDGTNVELSLFYGELRKRGLEYGTSFSTIREIWQGQPNSGTALGRITTSPFARDPDPDPYQDVVLLDGCLQVFGVGLETLSDQPSQGAFIPASIQSMTFRQPLPNQVWSHVSLWTHSGGGAALAQIQVMTDKGEVLIEIDGLALHQKTNFAAEQSLEASTQMRRTINGDRYSTVASPINTESREQLIARLRQLPPDQQVEAVAKWLASEVKDIMGQAAEELDLDHMDPSTAFLEIGLNSLLVTEFQRRIQEKLNFRFQPMQGLDYQNIESLSEYILNEVLFNQTNTEGSPYSMTQDREQPTVSLENLAIDSSQELAT